MRSDNDTWDITTSVGSTARTAASSSHATGSAVNAAANADMLAIVP